MMGPIEPFDEISWREITAVSEFLRDCEPLSGYLAGKERGGRFVQELEELWCKTFHVKHAIAVNSATSGLMASAFAIGLKPGDTFVSSAMTMSATAAAPMFTGATPLFCDVDDKTFGICASSYMARWARLDYQESRQLPIFSTNLFGHSSDLGRLRGWCDANSTYLIEDNAQAPFATRHGRYAGTIGHIGVWSLNVHKPIQCGEGGIVTTDDDDLARKLRDFINHGENNGGPIGLNLRMPEICAVIAIQQLKEGKEIVADRVQQAEAIISAIGDIPGLRPPFVGVDCNHVYYTIPFLIDRNRMEFCAELASEGVPTVEGYVEPLYRLPAFNKFASACPVAEDLQDRRLFYIENCAYTFTQDQVRFIGNAFQRAATKWLNCT